MAIIHNTPAGPVVYDCPFVPAGRSAPWGWGQGLDAVDRMKPAGWREGERAERDGKSCGDATNGVAWASS